MKDIKLGYEVGSGKKVNISASHLIVTGVTQLSGKTTTLEALIKRSGLKAIVFKTKIGEKSFTDGTEVTPFFRDRSDYDFVKSLIEAYTKEKLFLEKGTLMMLCKGSSSLVEIKKKVDEVLAEGKLRGLKEEIHIRLQHYLENLIPQIQYANFSNTLDIYDGVNIMNLERFSEEAQSLIIQSVAEEVLKTMKGVIIVIPEAWKFLPQKYNNPCKRSVESYIRQGASNNNFIWIDSQDMAGVDKIPLKQISTWILGYQSERNEVKHTLDQIALPKGSKPKEEEIMGLRKGHFILSCYDGVKSVYVQPVWLEDGVAVKVAKGKLKIDDLEAPSNLTPTSFVPSTGSKEEDIKIFDDSKLRKNLIELRSDFFNKIEELQVAINKAYELIYSLQNNKQEVDVDEVVSLVLQKMPKREDSKGGTLTDIDSIVTAVLSRIPKSGNVVYEIAPLEKIKKDFLNSAKARILADVESLSDDEKKALKYVESRESDVSNTELILKCFLMKQCGSSSGKVSKIVKNLECLELIKKSAGGRASPFLKERIAALCGVHEITDLEVQQVYDHILMEVLK